MYIDLVKIAAPTTIAFIVGILITPIATHFFYKYKMWKKKARSETLPSREFKLIHEERRETEVRTPCVGGLIVLFSVLLTIFSFYLLSVIFPGGIFEKLNFLSRGQTYLTTGIFILGALLGFGDDLLEIVGKWHITRDSHWYTKLKIALVILLGLVVGAWFYYKLGMHTIHIPFVGPFDIGILLIFFVSFVLFSTFSSGVIDGLDGLSGGVLASIFGAYSMIAFLNNQINLAAFCGVAVGAILAFLWFNIPPARFYMGESGMMPLTITLALIAFLTDSVLILPVIAMPLVATSASDVLQILSKKIRGKRIFRVAPLHHHFEAIGWPSYKVTMRYWVLSIVFAIIGVILFIISR